MRKPHEIRDRRDSSISAWGTSRNVQGAVRTLKA
jgi:hypothetical protein